MTTLLSKSYFVGKVFLKTGCRDYKVILSYSESHKLVNKKPLLFQSFKCHDKEWNMSIICYVSCLKCLDLITSQVIILLLIYLRKIIWNHEWLKELLFKFSFLFLNVCLFVCLAVLGAVTHNI
jgi:hypothetical protein